ncbi:hypothetical protein BG015_006648 [Linnemannia schmuckeri]|uniref:Uncharacterized protein n=1 Tax=Linnemannia schmuckeri TaxID=64567 RepID=A0A9P5VBT4_9FUNG|nr:hypothetical protein BG015_006648 [Linnemannia schmuckeri]
MYAEKAAAKTKVEEEKLAAEIEAAHITAEEKTAEDKTVRDEATEKQNTLGCSFSGAPKAIKNSNHDLHRNKVSKRTNYPLKIIVWSPKNKAPAWHITTIHPAHNTHAFQSGTQEFNRIDKQLSDEMHAMIASFDGRFDLEQTIFLLNKDWSDKILDRRIVVNAIQKAKIKASRYNGSEAVELYRTLQGKAHQDKN